MSDVGDLTEIIFTCIIFSIVLNFVGGYTHYVHMAPASK